MSAARAPRLKSLDLQGYKTFASRTVFAFAPTITAIVGPNGSGKSNIADAIRWVLGEQAYSLLRGKRTDDMIFSGSEARPRASMASAGITFDNSEAWLPIEFSEVSVGRRAYRDGENEYLLNGQRVRLREVVELLARSGLAQRTYTIVGQGLVDAALSLRPEERRALFEEAAGIGLYRARREEALRRLEATEHNLERVQDILAELRPRLRALERQAKRAQEYEEVRLGLQASLLQWYGHHWHRSQRLVAAARREAEERVAVRDTLREGQAQALVDLARRRSEIGGLRGQLHASLEQGRDLDAEREDLQRRAAVDGERLRWLQEQGASLASEIETLRISLEEARARLERSRLEAAAEEDALQAAGDTGSEPGLPEGAPDPLESAVAREAAWKAHLESATLALEVGRRRLEGLVADLGIHQAEWTRADSAVTEARGHAEALEAAARNAARGVDELRSRAQEARTAFQRAEEEQTRILQRQAALQARLEVIAAREQTLARLLEAGQQGKLPGLLGRWANQWRVASLHRTAIAAALGEFADGLSFQSLGDLDRALGQIGSADAPATAAFLAAGAGDPPPRLAGPADPEYVGNAAELVSAPPEMKSVVDWLLGRTWVVNSAEAARRLQSVVPHDGRVVTLQGEVFHPGGPVLVSRRDSGRDAQQRLSADLEKARVGLEVNQSETRRLAADAETLSKQFAEAETALAHARQTAANAAMMTNESALRREASHQRAELLRGQTQEAEAELERAQAELRRLEHEGREVSEGRTRAESIRRETDREKAARLLAGTAAGIELLRRTLAEARRAVDERSERVAAMEAEVGSRRMRHDGNQRQQTETEAQLATTRARLTEVEGALEALRTERLPPEGALSEAEAERERLEVEEGKGRLALQAEESEAARILIELARREEEATSLRRRIEDDFGLVSLPTEDGVPAPEPLPLEGIVQSLPLVEDLPMEVEMQVQRLRGQIRRMGAVNPEADTEYHEVKERVEFLTAQTGDLRQAEGELRQVVGELDELMQKEFLTTFDAVAAAFRQTFTRLFQGGSARLTLVNPDDLSEAGIEIEARLPGKREQGLAMLSGGERSLTACALIFALLKVSPTPFCVLDEVDAMLDEANVARFREMLVELSADIQFLIITHNRETVQAAETVYGVSMGPDSASQVISLRLDEAVKSLAA